MKQKCLKPEHCWHVTGSTTNGLAIHGWDDFKCCWCGAESRREWTNGPDPSHGGQVPTKAVFYDDNEERR